MNEPRDLQHPDITQAERTGYPWFPRKITLEATQDHAKAYCAEHAERFFDFVLNAWPSAVTGFLDDNESDFSEFVVCADF